MLCRLEADLNCKTSEYEFFHTSNLRTPSVFVQISRAQVHLNLICIELCYTVGRGDNEFDVKKSSSAIMTDTGTSSRSEKNLPTGNSVIDTSEPPTIFSLMF